MILRYSVKSDLNLDFGRVVARRTISVTLVATGFDNAPPSVQAQLGPALEAERLEIENEVSDYKAWPVVSLGFVYNF